MSSMQAALTKAGLKRAPIPPLNPSRRATARVTNPLPVPTICPYCNGPVQLVSNRVIYGREYGEWPWAYRCCDTDCDSYVGLHPFTAIPLGTLANAATRNARKRAKAVFNPMWQNGTMTRNDAYAWLAAQLGIANKDECHIGWFDVDRCMTVVEVCNNLQTRTENA